MDRVPARGVGVKVPVRRKPLACAEGRLSKGTGNVKWGIRTWTESSMLSKDSLELGDEGLTRLHNRLIGWERHGGLCILVGFF
jgi:hypothetical protein